jgi:phage terminase large subunit-like protein
MIQCNGEIEPFDRNAAISIIRAAGSYVTELEISKFSIYKPNDIMLPFHASTASIRALFGGNRSGKTYSGAEDAAISFLGAVPPSLDGHVPSYRVNPKRRLRMCTVDYDNLFFNVLWEHLKTLIPPSAIKSITKTNGRIKSIHNAHGGMIQFMQYEQDADKFQGSALDAVYYDEEPPSDIRRECMMRLVDRDGEEVFTLTPVSGAMKWLYDDIVVPSGRIVEKNYELILDKKGDIVDVVEGSFVDKINPEGNSRIHCFYACIFDNKYIKKEAAMRIISDSPPAEREMRSKGHFVFIQGVIYKDFSSQTHVVPSSKEWQTERHYSLYIAIDTHYKTPHHVLFFVVRKDGAMFVVDELMSDNVPVMFVKEINEKRGGKLPEVIIYDALANTPDPASRKTFIDSLIDAGLNFAPLVTAPKDPTRGIRMVQELISGEKPTIRIMDNCPETIYEMIHWSWDSWEGGGRDRKDPKQLPVKKRDHMMENLGRLAMICPDWREPKNPHEDFENDSRKGKKGVGTNSVTGY